MIATTLAPRRVAPGAGETYHVLGDRVTCKALAAETGGAYTLLELHTAPGGGSAPHIQRHEDEAFFVLEGTYSALIGDERVELGPGSYVFVPRGTVHALTNSGDIPARMLSMITPGGNFEQFLAEIGERIDDPLTFSPGLPPSETRLARAAANYGVEFCTDKVSGFCCGAAAA